MIKMMDFHGHNVVAPITGKDMEMVAPLEDYFNLHEGIAGTVDGMQDPLIAWWFGLGEQTRKDCIRDRDDHKCLFCKKAVDSDEVHEIIGKGASGGKPALVPWNQVTVCREHHELLQQYKWTIYRFDPLDKENGLIVIGQDGKRIANSELWFYNRPDKDLVDEANERFHMMEEALLANRNNEANFAENSFWMKEHDGASILGLGTHKAMLAQMHASTARDERLRTIYERALDRGVWNQAKQIDPDQAYKLLKRIKQDGDYEWLIPSDKLNGWFADALALSPGDFHRKYTEALGQTRPRKRFAINGAVQMYEIEAGDPDGMDADVVIDGGRVVKGEVG